MIVCPVCEHPQAQGFECDNCGRQLVSPREIALAVTPLAELEQTRQSDGGAPVLTTPLPDLELTRIDSSAPVPAAAPMPELEVSRAPAVQVSVQLIPDLDAHRLAEPNPAERTPAPTGAVVCRYCRNVQAEGALCERCGMRLPRIAKAAPVCERAEAGSRRGPTDRAARVRRADEGRGHLLVLRRPRAPAGLRGTGDARSTRGIPSATFRRALDTPALRAELEKLQSELSARASTLQFAHAGVSTLAALIIGSASAKLFWDSVKVPYLGILAAAVALGLAVYALIRCRQGLKSARLEQERFERMQGIQRTLGIDDPAALLPSR